jgi:argininosuccinate lyase
MTDTLWGGHGSLSALIGAYTVGEDRLWDQRLLPWDILGTLAHVEGLAAIGIVTGAQARTLRAELRRMLRDARVGRFKVGTDDEDVHTAVERRLVARLGEIGERVHTGRSRNDQVLADLRLFSKDRLLAVMGSVVELARACLTFARRHRDVVFPGYTHQRRAMPSTIGLWAASFAELLLDDIEPLRAALALTDRSPLGSAAGFGVPLPLERELVASRLGFAGVQGNVAAVQASRGKLEVVILSALWTVAYDLAKLAWDVILFSAEEFGYLRIPEDLATGSSIMPHKRNPDVFELTRARAGVLDGLLAQAMAVAGRLPSGYHRDLQLGKGVFMRGFDTVEEMLAMMTHAVPRLVVERAACVRALTPGMFAADEALRRVRQGQSFRAAYRDVAAELRRGIEPPALTARQILAARTSTGGLGNLGLERVARLLTQRRRELERARRGFAAALARLAGRAGGGR